MTISLNNRALTNAFRLSTLGAGALLLVGCVYTDTAEQAAIAYLQEAASSSPRAAASEQRTGGVSIELPGPANSYFEKSLSANLPAAVKAGSWLGKCGNLVDFQVTPLKEGKDRASFSVAMTNADGESYTVSNLTLTKEKFRWWVTGVDNTQVLQEVVPGPSDGRMHFRTDMFSAKPDEDGVKLLNPRTGKEEAVYRIRYSTKGVCEVSANQLAKMNAANEALKTELLAKAKEAAELYKQQQELEAMKAAVAQESSATATLQSVEAKKTILTRMRQSGPTEVTNLINQYFAALSKQDLGRAGGLWDGAERRVEGEQRIYQECGGVLAMRASPPIFVPIEKQGAIGYIRTDIDVQLKEPSARNCRALRFSQSHGGGGYRLTYKFELSESGRWYEVR